MKPILYISKPVCISLQEDILRNHWVPNNIGSPLTFIAFYGQMEKSDMFVNEELSL